MKSTLLCVFLITNLFAIRSDQVLQCKDENNEPVDWFVMYKVPKIRESSNTLVRSGIAYLYMTNKSVSEGWKLSTKDITMKGSIPGNTLSILYDDKVASNLMWVMYNDHPPNGRSNGNYGHTKGVAMTNGETGVWLIHSVPGYPAVPRTGESARRSQRLSNETVDAETKSLPDGEYAYPDTGKPNGQSFLCLSVKADQIEAISQQLMYNQIIVYRKNVPEAMVKKFPSFADAAQQKRIKKPPYNRKATITTILGTEFTSFAKSDKWQRDLYDEFVGPQLNSDLLVESWLNGRGRLPSDCNGSRVYNVESVKLDPANVVFSSTHDHSKWAVSSTNGTNGNWVCVGDINRADTQFSRGGGTVCIKSSSLWNSYKNSVNDIEPCPKKPGFFKKIKNWVVSKIG